MRFPILCGIVLSCATSVGAATLVVAPPDGGACATLGGTWDAEFGICSLQTLTIDPGDTLIVEPLAKLSIGLLGTVHNFGTIQADGLVTAEFAPDDMLAQWTNHPGSLLEAQTIFGGLQIDNRGTMRNYGQWVVVLVRNEIEGTFINFGTVGSGENGLLPTRLENDGTVENQQSFQLDSFTNRGHFENLGTLATYGADPEFENAGRIVNFESGEITATNTITNSGLLVNHGQLTTPPLSAFFPVATDNSGILANTPTGTILNDSNLENSGAFCNGGILSGAGEILGNPPETGPDSDGDGLCDAVDLEPLEPSCWMLPGPVRELRAARVAAGAAQLDWYPPSLPGGNSVEYDVISSMSTSDFSSATGVCVESDDGFDTSALDVAIPPDYELIFYLVRPENLCGEGPLGQASNPRSARSCP